MRTTLSTYFHRSYFHYLPRHIVAINDTKVWHIPTNSNKYSARSNKCSTKSNKYSTKSIYSQSVTTQKCGTFIEYIIKRHIVAINDTKVWHILTNSNKYKAKVINIRQTVANIRQIVTNIRQTVANIKQKVANIR